MKRIGVFLLAAGAIAASGSWGCTEVAGSRTPVLVVGDQEFDHEELDRYLAPGTGGEPAPGAMVLSVLLEEFIRERLLLIAADEAGVEAPALRLEAELAALGRDPASWGAAGGDGAVPTLDAEGVEVPQRPLDLAWLRRRVEERLRVEELLHRVVLAEVEASEEAARLEFDSGRGFYVHPETITLSEWRFTSREDAEAGALRLREAAASDSRDIVGTFVSIGTFRRGVLPEPMERVVFAMSPGETSPVLETAAGYRIFRVDARVEQGPAEFDEVREVAERAVLEREADARLEAFLRDLESRHPVVVHTGRLNFPYLGPR